MKGKLFNKSFTKVYYNSKSNNYKSFTPIKNGKSD